MRVLLALPLVVSAACGDNLSGPQDPETEGVDPRDATETVTVERYSPQVCGAQTFPSVRLDAKDNAIRAVPYPGGMALFAVPSDGGMLRGVLLDGRGNVIGDPAGQKIRSDLAFTSLAASRVDDRFVVGLVAGDRTHITAIRDDLGAFRELAVADGALVGDTTVMHTRGSRVTVTGGATGLVVTAFDTAWAERGSTVVSTSAPTSMTSVPYGTDAVVAWSTATECHIRGVAGQTESMQPYPCQDGRIALDFASRGGWMVYERDASIMIGRLEADGHEVIANERVLAPMGRAPRIAFDGSAFWVSYIGADGDVVVGMLDKTGALPELASTGMAPVASSYDLVVDLGKAAIYATDGRGLGATWVCKTREP